MNQLIVQDVKMTSLDIAEVTGKRHADLMKDIRKEIKEIGEEIAQGIFALGSYKDKNNQDRPCYEFGKKGAMQLALKYDAKTRYEVIQYVDKLENKTNLDTNQFSPELQALIGIERRQNEQDKRLDEVEKTTNDIKEVFSLNTLNWRK